MKAFELLPLLKKKRIKIRRAEWIQGAFIEAINDPAELIDQSGREYELSHADYLATDWEVVLEKRNRLE